MQYFNCIKFIRCLGAPYIFGEIEPEERRRGKGAKVGTAGARREKLVNKQTGAKREEEDGQKAASFCGPQTDTRLHHSGTKP